MAVLGADVDALDALARRFDQESRQLVGSMTAIEVVMRSAWWSGANATRFEREWHTQHAAAVRSVAHLLTDASRGLAAQSKQQRTTSNDTVVPVALSLLFAGAATAAGPFSSMSDAERAAFLATLTREEQRALLASDPAAIANLDGAPIWMRDEANRQLMRMQIAQYRAELARLQRQMIGSVGINGPGGGNLSELSRLQHRIDVLTKAVDDHSFSILKFDPDHGGRLIAAYGDLEHAKNVAVLVPGVSNDAFNSLEGHGVLSDARTLAHEINRKDTAVVAWLDYDAPNNAFVAESSSAADAGAPALRRFVSDVRAQGAQNVTVIAHSYGSVLAGHAARDGVLDADHLIVVGSPGTGVDHASDLQLHSGGDVWAGYKRGDKVGLIGNVGAADLFGPDPAGDSFGAKHLDTSGGGSILGTNHQYYQGDSLEHMSRIVSGRG